MESSEIQLRGQALLASPLFSTHSQMSSSPLNNKSSLRGKGEKKKLKNFDADIPNNSFIIWA